MRGSAGRIAILLASTALAAGCSASPTPPPELSSVSLPGGNGVYKIGEPYEQEGIWYYPREQPEYDETGVASWYGADFHGHRTANGEVFDANGLTAAHPTLPMPVNVRVTNLENGKSLVLRVNDRGPFKRGRIIDVSAHAAQLLGFYGKGTAKVRVTYLARADGPMGLPQDTTTDTALAAAAAASAVPAGSMPVAAAPTGAVQVASLDPVATPPGPAVTVPPAQTAARPPEPSDVPSPSPEKIDEKLAAADAGALPQSAPSAAPPPETPATNVAMIPDAAAPSGSSAVPSPAPEEAAARTDTKVDAKSDTKVAAISDAAPVVTTLAVPAVTHLYVQLGAFSIKANAERLKDRLSAAGNLEISPIGRKGQTLYRVRIGPFDDVSAADSALAEASGLGSTDAKIVVDQ